MEMEQLHTYQPWYQFVQALRGFPVRQPTSHTPEQRKKQYDVSFGEQENIHIVLLSRLFWSLT